MIKKNKKSVVLAVVLAFFFGFLGLLYSTVKGALIMFVILISVVLVMILGLEIDPGKNPETFRKVGVGISFISALLAYKYSTLYNKKLDEELTQESDS